MERIRLDILLTERGLSESRSQAQRLVMAGQVRVDGQVEIKPSTRFPVTVQLSVDLGPRFVSRGGEKLEAAIEAFHLTDLKGWNCVDVGASTGGFTDCLLQHGAAKVYAVDVGYGVLHWKLRNDPRVVSMERTNARHVSEFLVKPQLVTVDASFISLRILLPVIRGWFDSSGGRVMALIKPQFEAGRADSARGEGVIRDSEVHRHVLQDVLKACQVEGYEVKDLIRSPLIGPKGNVEFLVHLEYPASLQTDYAELINNVLNPGIEAEAAEPPEARV